MREIFESSLSYEAAMSAEYSTFCEKNKDVLKYFNIPIPSLEDPCVIEGENVLATNYDFIDLLIHSFSNYGSTTTTPNRITGPLFTELVKQMECCFKISHLVDIRVSPSVVGFALSLRGIFTMFGLESEKDKQSWNAWVMMSKRELTSLYKENHLWDYTSKQPSNYKGIIQDGAKNSYKCITDVCNKFGMSPNNAQYAIECSHEYGLHFVNDIYNKCDYNPPTFTLTEKMVEEVMKKYPELGICGWPSPIDWNDRAKFNPVITWDLLVNGTDSNPGNNTNGFHIPIIEHLVNAFKGYGYRTQKTKNKSYDMYKEDIKHYLQRTAKIDVRYLPQGLVVLACILYGFEIEESSYALKTFIRRITYKQMFTVYNGNAYKKLNGYTICNF